MKFSTLSLALTALLSLTIPMQAAPTEDRPESHLLEPFWKSEIMPGEALLFTQEKTGERPQARLLFNPTQILSVKSASGEITYLEGKDYILDTATNSLILPEGSRIPFKTDAELRPPAGSPNSMKGHIDGQRNLLWSEGHFFHDLQAEVTYKHAVAEWNSTPTFAGESLPKTLAKLRGKEALGIVGLGDSISQGYNASGYIKLDVAPKMPPYAELVRRNLQEHYGSEITLTNLSVAGRRSAWGLSQIPALVAAKPDLVILAFGMNDAGATKTETYISNLKRQISTVRATLPDAEFVVVASMLSNPEWSTAKSEQLGAYRVALQELRGEGVVIADVTAVWSEIVKRKSYLDLSGNGLNHPNDFGHRIYAQVILSLLVDQAKP